MYHDRAIGDVFFENLDSSQSLDRVHAGETSLSDSDASQAARGVRGTMGHMGVARAVVAALPLVLAFSPPPLARTRGARALGVSVSYTHLTLPTIYSV